MPALKGSAIPASVKRCLAGKTLVTTTCTASHTYRAAGALTSASRSTRAASRSSRSAAAAAPQLVTTDADYRFTWSGKTVWNVARDHTLVCYNRNG